MGECTQVDTRCAHPALFASDSSTIYVFVFFLVQFFAITKPSEFHLQVFSKSYGIVPNQRQRFFQRMRSFQADGLGSPGRALPLPQTKTSVARQGRGDKICILYLKHILLFLSNQANKARGHKMASPHKSLARPCPGRIGQASGCTEPSTQQSRPEGQTEGGGNRSGPGLQVEYQDPPGPRHT